MASAQTHNKLEALTLSTARIGQALKILAIPDMSVAAQIVRMGIYEGSQVVISTRLPGGPSVLQMGALEVALGYDIARCIQVAEVESFS